jgi:ATP-dependent Lon protease
MGTPPTSGQLPLLPLRSTSLFPGVTLPIDLGRPSSVEAVRRATNRPKGDADSNLVIVATQRDAMTESPRFDDLHGVAVVGRLVQVLHGLPGRLTVLVRGLERVHLHSIEEAGGFVMASYELAHDSLGDPTLTHALSGALQDLVAQHDEMLPANRKSKQRQESLAELHAERRPGRVADMAAAHVDLDAQVRASLLQELHVPERLRRTLELISHQLNVLQVKRDLDRQVRDNLSQHEHETYLRHQLRAIKAELGEGMDDDDVVGQLRVRLSDKDLTDEARAAVERELKRLDQMNPQSSEATVARTYCEWVLDLPWGDGDATEDRLDIQAAREQLERDHYGLEKVKRRVIEYLSVRKLAPKKRGPILCLAGPPGVGKTSLAQSIATALGRNFVRIALGGVRDDAEIRGHRRTYVGANPGRFVVAMKQAHSINPVILLDEVDKLTGSDLRGDPASALLEALDPEQNDAFRDHYLDVDYDLSRVLFICTANDLGGIPHVLRDRLEIIELGGYTIDDKLAIARDHLLPKVAREHGLQEICPEVDDAVLDALATQYTRESGVRELQRKLAALLRDVAMRVAEGAPPPARLDAARLEEVLGPPRYHEELADKEPAVGVVTGLGWTRTGGRLLFVESTITPGEGRLRLTGNVGDVMRESGQAALSLVRAEADRFGIDPAKMRTRDVHLHLPAGGIPKDGPSAGIALTTSVVSAFSHRPVRCDVAMTGEVTLRGHVLPVGGIREKLLAAHRAGIREVILPSRNRKDEPDIPEGARADLTLHYVNDIAQVLDLVLLDPLADEDAAE